MDNELLNLQYDEVGRLAELGLLDNDLLKSHINMIISYSEYISNKQNINNYINMGFNFAILIDKTYHDEIDNLILFSYVLVYDNLPSYDMIIIFKDSKVNSFQ